MGLQPPQILTIYAIFEKDIEGSYKQKNAFLLQDILLYPIQSHKSDFKFQELANWLVDNNREFRDELGLDKQYSSAKHIRKSYFIAKKHDRIQAQIDYLKNLGLVYVKERVKALKNNGDTPLYALTNLGDLTSWFVYMLWTKESKRLDMAAEKMFRSIVLFLHPNERHSDKFQLIFFGKCWEMGIFHRVFKTMRQEMRVRKQPYGRQSILDLFNHIMRYAHMDKDLAHDIWTARLEILKIMEDRVLQAVLLKEKLAIENSIANSSDATAEWEDMTARNIGNLSRLTIPAFCFCGAQYPVVVDYFEFRQAVANSDIGVMKARCKKCGMNEGLTIRI